MLKKIRCFYWGMRDKGKGKQVIAAVLVILLAILSVGGLIGKSVFVTNNRKAEKQIESGAVSGTVAGVSGVAVTETFDVSESAVSDDNSGTVPESTEIPTEIKVDTSGLDAFHGFMTDDAYSAIEEQIVSECGKRGCTSAKKLNYQQTADGSFDVVSFILFSDGSIYQCNYNLKSCAATLDVTGYTESDITAMHDAEMKTEQAALEKQQKADKKAWAKKKAKEKGTKKTAKKKSKKKAGRKSRKKISGKKADRKKKH